MRRRLAILGAVVALAAFTAGTARAVPPGDPFKANKAVLNLAQGYQACTSPNTSTAGALALAACQPAVLNDTNGCVFDTVNKGSGKVTASVTGLGDIKIKVSMKKLIPGGGGCVLDAASTQYFLNASFRATTTNCQAGASCTTTDLTLPLVTAPCTVNTAGTCTVSTTFNTLVPGAIALGDATTIQILGCSVQRVGASAPGFVCGLHVP